MRIPKDSSLLAGSSLPLRLTKQHETGQALVQNYSEYEQVKGTPKFDHALENFKLETTTVWSFPSRGSWATHVGDYRGNWSPYVPRNIILRYSKEGDLVLDPFLGSGTTLIETKLLRRKGIGVDINSRAVSLAKERLAFEMKNTYEQQVLRGDARSLDFLNDGSVDLICTHPPYANIIKYSKQLKGDLSHLDVDNFVEAMKDVACEFMRVLRSGRIIAFLIGDTRKHKRIVPLGIKTLEVFNDVGFQLQEIVIKQQHNCQSSGYWENTTRDFLLINHEYLFVMRKP